MILAYTLLLALVSIVVFVLEFRRIRPISLVLLLLQLLLFALVFVSWPGISF